MVNHGYLLPRGQLGVLSDRRDPQAQPFAFTGMLAGGTEEDTRGNLHGGKAGEEPEASESRLGPKTGKSEGSRKGLLGPPAFEQQGGVEGFGSSAQGEKGGQVSLLGQPLPSGLRQTCVLPSHSHGTAPKWEHLDWAVQLQMLRRGGLRCRKAKSWNKWKESGSCSRQRPKRW